MRVGIGAILGTLGGPATYARELIRALAEIDTTNQYIVITDRPEALAVGAPNVCCVRAPLPTALLQPLWDHVWVPYFVRRCRADIYHGTKGVLPLRLRCPAVVTVHDLAVYHQPRTFSVLQRLHQRTHTPYAVRCARRVIAVSEFGRQDLLRHFSLPADQVVAIPLAAPPCFAADPSTHDEQTAKDLRLPERYVLYAGTIQPRKNVESLVAAFRSVRDRRGVDLVIAGRVRPGYHPGFVAQPPAGVRYVGPVEDRVLAVLYRRALALCSPSSFEGFGLSLLEAMTSGCPVIAGANSAIEELVGDCGILLPDLSEAGIAGALERVMDAEGEREALRQRGRQRAALYSWRETARRTLAVYREAMGAGGAG